MTLADIAGLVDLGGTLAIALYALYRLDKGLAQFASIAKQNGEALAVLLDRSKE